MKIPRLFQKARNEIELKVNQAQRGNENVREELLERYQPFIKKMVSEVTKKYIDDSMDEFSVGLLAFNEAIDQYRSSENGTFLGFSSVVIKRRVIDYIRKEYRNSSKIDVRLDKASQEDSHEEHYIHQKSSLDSYGRLQEQQERMNDILEYQKLLLEFGITFEVLSEKSPKHYDARENAKLIAKLVAGDEEMREEVMTKKRLPIQKLESRVSFSRKTIERQRKYIIAIALVYIGGFTSLKPYITPEKGVD